MRSKGLGEGSIAPLLRRTDVRCSQDECKPDPLAMSDCLHTYLDINIKYNISIQAYHITSLADSGCESVAP